MQKTKKCVGKEGYQRMNYLYQLSNAHVSKIQTNSASSLYSNMVINISKKTVQKLELNIKRSICKGCRSLLLAGVTCTVRIRKQKLHYKCLTCFTVKSFNIGKNYKLWLEQPEAIVESLDYKIS